jgi:hypothetical protein
MPEHNGHLFGEEVRYFLFFLSNTSIVSLILSVYSPANLEKAKDGRKFMLRLLVPVREFARHSC